MPTLVGVTITEVPDGVIVPGPKKVKLVPVPLAVNVIDWPKQITGVDGLAVIIGAAGADGSLKLAVCAELVQPPLLAVMPV